MAVRFLEPASHEMRDAAMRYDAAAMSLGERFLSAVQSRIDQAAEFPQVGNFIGDLPLYLAILPTTTSGGMSLMVRRHCQAVDGADA